MKFVSYEPSLFVTKCGDVFHNGVRRAVQHIFRNGRKYVSVSKRTADGGRVNKKYLVHRLVAEVWCSGNFPGAVVNHMDCNPLNNDASNLEWVTHKRNSEHAMENGRMKTGQLHHGSKISSDMLVDIFSMRSRMMSQKRIADLLGVNHRAVGDVLNGISYKNEVSALVESGKIKALPSVRRAIRSDNVLFWSDTPADKARLKAMREREQDENT